MMTNFAKTNSFERDLGCLPGAHGFQLLHGYCTMGYIALIDDFFLCRYTSLMRNDGYVRKAVVVHLMLGFLVSKRGSGAKRRYRNAPTEEATRGGLI